MSPGAQPRHRQAADERGQTAPLMIGFTVVLVLMVAVVVDATAAFLRRQALGTLADGAALAATDGIATARIYTHGVSDRPELDPAQARRLVLAYLTSVDAGRRYPGLAHTVEVDGARVVVRLAAPLDLPLPVPGVADHVRVGAEAAATATVAR